MATFWVDQSRPDDTGDGLTFATAKKLLASGCALLTTKNDILNIVNSGEYAWPTVEIDFTTDVGTSFTDYGFLIRGVTGASETPGYARIATDTADANAVRRCFRISAGAGFIILRNLIFDDTEKFGDTNAHSAIRYNSPGGPVWADGCAFLAAATGVTHSGTHQFLNVQAGGVDGTRIWDCYFQNMQNAVHGITGGGFSVSTIGNLFYLDAASTAPTLMTRSLGAGTGDTFDLTYNTFYYSIGNNTVSPVFSYAMAGASDAGPVSINSNLYFVESSNSSPNVEFISDTGGPIPFTGGTVGFNVLLGGPGVAVGDLNADGWYVGDTFDVGADPKATDQAAYEQAEATIFNAPGSTYAWDQLGNGATVTILKDLRPRLFLTAGIGSTVPGALPAASTDYGIDLATSNSAPEEGTTFTITVTASNTGTSATDVVMTALKPAGLTLVTAVPSQGLYNSLTGVWTIGSMSSGGTATLVLTVTVNTGQAGNTIVMSASTTSGDPANDPNSANNTDSLSLPIPQDPGTDPTATTYIDVAPIFAPVLRAEVNALIRTDRNRLRQNELRHDLERHIWREFASRRITVAPSTTVSVVTAIERADIFVLEATGNLEVSVSESATDVYFPPASRLALVAGDFTTLKLRNPSATASVDALLVVID